MELDSNQFFLITSPSDTRRGEEMVFGFTNNLSLSLSLSLSLYFGCQSFIVHHLSDTNGNTD
jgi:hypothetical protein